jgi:putative Mg2+ transporter-C (MgtC) family protein
VISVSDVIFRLAAALVLGGLIGIEREWRYHSAGLRTNALVSLGSALFTLVSAFGFTDLARVAHMQIDPTRIASYIVAGIGFLGGGAIYTMEKNEKVKGLTTASAIWMVAAVGMACGIGFLWEAVVATAFALFVLVGLYYAEINLFPFHVRTQLIHLDVSSISGLLLEQLYELCEQHDVEIEKIDIVHNEPHDTIGLNCRFQKPKQIVHLLAALHGLSDVQTVRSSFPIGGRKSAS